jgi:tetratricopeptide (TPR) repeat protein
MSHVTIEQAMQLAMTHLQAGRLREAEQLYRQILANHPRNSDAIHFLGVIAHQAGRLDVAVDLIRQAIAINPNDAGAFNNLGNALKDKGEIDAAIAAYRQSVSLRPNSPEAYCNLGDVLKNKGQLDEAMSASRQAIALKPNLPEAHCNLGNILSSQGQFAPAIAAYRQAIAISPDYPEAHNNLSIALREKGQLDGAIDACRRAIALRPNFAEAHNNLGLALIAKGEVDQAAAAARQAILLRPSFAEAFNNLGNALFAQGQFDQAIAAFRQSLSLNSDGEVVLFNLTTALAAVGQFDQVMQEYQRAAPQFNVTDAQSVPDAVRQIAPHARPWPDTANQVFAICSLRDGSELLPHWLEHYSNLGADQLLVGVFDDVISPKARDELARCAKRWKFTCFQQTWNNVPEALHEQQRRTGCRLAGAVPETWIMHTDLDEFHQFPAPLGEIVAAAEAQQIDAVIGWFLDRVARDGSLPIVRSSPTLWEQFPIGCRLTARVMRTVTQKIMLARFGVPVRYGHHHPVAHANLGLVPLGRADQYVVHHFKWRGDSLVRIQWSLSQPNIQPKWKKEATRFLTWLKANGGRINLEDPSLQAIDLGKTGQ